MAAYGLAIYEFRGRNAIMLFVIGTLMIPITVILVPVYLVVTQRWAWSTRFGRVILPGAATPDRGLPVAAIHADNSQGSD